MASAGDPVRSGLVSSLVHPGGNVTGLTVLGPGLAAKRLELLKEAVPNVSRVAFLWNPANPDQKSSFNEVQAGGELWVFYCTPSKHGVVRSWSKP
jgi:ABC-type uncharacterized transport system substrate-binding protein